MTRQLDKFEWKKGTDPKQPEAPAVRVAWTMCVVLSHARVIISVD